VVLDLDFLSAHLGVNRRDSEVLWVGYGPMIARSWCRGALAGHAERCGLVRTVPEFYTGAEILDDDERFTVRKQRPGWSRER
jgi:hypothetical protein